eukprot:3564127-Pyramimonas_sp.AAC.1
MAHSSPHAPGRGRLSVTAHPAQERAASLSPIVEEEEEEQQEEEQEEQERDRGGGSRRRRGRWILPP